MSVWVFTACMNIPTSSLKQWLRLYCNIQRQLLQISLQVMLLVSSLQLPPLVLVVPSPSDVLLLVVELLSGGWMVVAISVPWHFYQLHLILVGQVILLQLFLWLGLEHVVLPTHQHWVVLQVLHWMVHWLSALDQPALLTQEIGLEAVPSMF